MNALVVPTNSPARLLDFLRAWTPWPWDRVIVVEDLPEVDAAFLEALSPADARRVELFSWAQIDAALPDASIISREDSAIRSFGFWHAWRTGAEIILTLDDDCYPTADAFVEGHRDNLYRTPAWQSSVAGLHARGLPYRNLGVLRDVQVSMGLWLGSPDVDAITTLAGTGRPVTDADARTRVMSAQQYFPMSGMNLAFRREAACLMYFPPMGRGEPFARFDDIWCGIALQRICRHLGLSITCGHPLVDHRRASDALINLVKEAPGVAANERRWETVDAVVLTAGSPLGCMLELGAALAADADEYVARWGRSIATWCALFAAAPVTAAPPA